jgi:hypothetical protein
MRSELRILASAAMLALASVAFAQGTTGTTTPGTTTPTVTAPTTPTSNKGQANVAGKIAGNFTNLAGGMDNSLALVNALRAGTSVNLVTTTGTGATATTTTTTFNVPTKPMGWGNVKIALGLAQQQLIQAGITQPTPAQLQAALLGGDVTTTTGTGTTATTTTTTLKGVLQMRADGMGWGKIAHNLGTSVGPVVSKLAATNASLTAQNAGTTTSTTTTAAAPAPKVATMSGVTTAAGTTVSSHGMGNGARGITTASGGGSMPNGNAIGRGVVTANGAVAASGGVTTAQGVGHGNGQGLAKGHNGG